MTSLRGAEILLNERDPLQQIWFISVKKNYKDKKYFKTPNLYYYFKIDFCYNNEVIETEISDLRLVDCALKIRIEIHSVPAK